jgi:hypothetical protein
MTTNHNEEEEEGCKGACPNITSCVCHVHVW